MAVEEALKEFISELRGRLGSRLAKVVLFGSYVKDYADEWSDVDVLVVYVNAEPEEATKLVAEVATRIAVKYGVPLEPVVMSFHEYLGKSFLHTKLRGRGERYIVQTQTKKRRS